MGTNFYHLWVYGIGYTKCNPTTFKYFLSLTHILGILGTICTPTHHIQQPIDALGPPTRGHTIDYTHTLWNCSTGKGNQGFVACKS